MGSNSTYYETRAVRWDVDGPAEQMERHATLETAILDALELWPEDDLTDIEIHVIEGDVTTLVAKVRHFDQDPAVATVIVFDANGSRHISEYSCKYIEIFGRVHTNITLL